jgi:hypothetical protein
MTVFLAFAVLVLLIHNVVKNFTSRATITGLLYYISEEYNEVLEVEKVKELSVYAGSRMIKEFFHLK